MLVTLLHAWHSRREKPVQTKQPVLQGIQVLLELCLNILIEQLWTQILLSRKSLIPVVVNQQLVQFVEVPTHVRQLGSQTKQLFAETSLY